MVLESNTLDVLFVKDGQQGEDGKILYTWIKYAKDANGTGITDDPNGAIYIGISYNNESSIESNDPTQYAWTKIQGADGKKGEDAYTIFLENENISFATDENRNPLSEQAYTSGITIMKGAKPVTDFTIGDIAKTQGIAVAKTDTAIAISVVNGNPLPYDSGEIEIPITVGGAVFKKILTWTCAKKGDQGIQGPQGEKGEQGEKGKNGTSVTIINKSITYQLSTSGTTIPTGTWQTSPQTIPEGQYQWTKTSVAYSDGNKTESYSISYHGKNGSNGISVKTTSTSVKYQVGDSGTIKPTGTWQNNVPTVAQGKYLWTQTIVNYSDGNSTESYSVSYRGIDGSNGVNGMNAATIYLYQRATSTPSKPSNTLTYTFSTTKITGTLNNGWSTAIPTGTDAVYVTVASVSSKNDTATIATSVWSAPVVLAQNGKTGSDGKAGLNVATIYLYQRNTSKPSKPSASVTYTFSTGVASGFNNGWSQKIPDGTNPLYVTLATASSNTATDTILSSEWSDVVVMAQNGEDGQDGISPKVSLSKTGDTTTISIVDATGTHTQTVKDGTNGTPGAAGAAGKDGKTSYFHVKYSNDGGKTFTSNSGEDTGIYMGSYTDYTEADSTDVKKYNWVKVKGDKGDTGQKGQDGTSIKITSKSVTYQTSTSGTTPPTGTWSTTVPTVNNGQYLWTKTTVQYSDGNKTEAYSVSYKGTNGTNGTSVTVSKTEVTYQVSTSGTTAPTGTWQATMPSCDQGQYLWTKTYVKYSDGKDTTSYSVSYKGVDGEKFAFNMLRETNQGSKHWEQHSSGGKYSVEDFITEDNINAVKLICTEAISTSNWSYVSFKDIKMLKQLKPSTKYTLSYDIKANRSGAISHSICKGDASNSCTNTVVVNNIIGNETWQHISVVLTTNDLKTTPTNEILYLGRNALSKVGYSIIKNLKLTEGIVDTPWVPHPEDLEGRGVSETIQYYLATSQASGVTSSTSGWSTDITTQKLTADKKYLWNCYQTKYSDGTSEPISTPKVIGVYGDKGQKGDTGQDGAGFHWNLLSGTKDFDKTKMSIAGATSFDSQKYLGLTVIKAVSPTGSGYVDPVAWNGVITPTPNTQYTISFYAKASVTTRIASFFHPNCTIKNISNYHTTTAPDGCAITKLSTEWNRYSVTWTTSSSVSGAKSIIPIRLEHGNTTDGATVYLCGIKLEQSDKPSPWCTTYEETLAKNLSITPSSQYFKSTDGGKTFAPNTITIKPTIQGEINFGKWQYSIDGGVSFADVVSGQKGLMISNNVLTVSKDSSLYSDAVTMVTFRAVASDSSFYDTCSIAKIYDVSDIGDGRNLWITRDNITLQACEKDKYIYTTTGTSAVCIGADVNSVGTNTIALQTGTKYTISFVISSPSEVGYAQWFFCTALNGTAVKNYGGYAVKLVAGENIVSQTITVDTSCDAAGLVIYNLPTGCIIKDIQVEKGSSPTGWSPAPEDIQTAILSTKSEISDVSLKVDKNKQAIEQRVEKTTYQQDLNLVKGDISKANEGLNKWRYEIYPKSLFASEYQGKSTMDVFAKNTNLTPSQSVLINDTDLSIAWNYAENYIGYALTFAKFSAAKSVAITFAHDDGAHIYLNGKLIGGSDAHNNNGESLTLGFVKGWNCIEVVVNEGANTEGFKLGTTISVLSECQLMNCYYGTPVARQSHITNQLVQNTTDIKGISTKVSKVTSVIGDNGENFTSFKNEYSDFKQTMNGFKTTVGQTYVTKDDFNGLEIGGRNLLKQSSMIGEKLICDDYFGCNNCNTKEYTNDGFHIITPTEGNGNNGIAFAFHNFTTLGINGGDTITFSCDIKGTSDSHAPFVSIHISDNNWYGSGVVQQNTSVSISSSWQRVSTTITVPTGLSNNHMWLAIHGNYQSDLYIKNFKLEKGNKATDWTPALEDNEINGQNLVSNLPTNWEQGGINGGQAVGSTYASIKSSTTYRIRIKDIFSISSNITVSAGGTTTNSAKETLSFYGTLYDAKRGLLRETSWKSFPSTINCGDAKYMSIILRWGDGTKTQITPSDISQICLKIERGTSATAFTLAPEDVNGKIVNVETIANQTAKKFEWIVKGESTSSNLVLTDNALTAIANNINLTGKVTFNSFDQSLKDTINNKTNVSYLNFGSGGNKQGFFKIATLQVKLNYVDQNIIFGVNHREHGYTECRIKFSNAGNTDPGMGNFKQTGTPTGAWRIIKTATSTWDLYLAKTDSWDSGRVIKFDNPYGDGVLVTWSGASADLPDGAIIAEQMIADQTTIDGGIITTGYLSADRIAGDSITADKIATDAITADKIVANAITADKIATDAIKSRNYISSGGTQGSFLNLSDGSFTAPNLSWDLNGNLIAKNANLSGEITATNGSIGKYKITDQWLITGSGSTATGIGGNQAFWAGAEDSNSAPFRVGYDGKLYANGATISGDITATTGKIGDLTLKDGILTGTGSYSEPYTEDDDGTVTSTITTNYITKLFGKGLTIDSTVKYSDEDDVYSYKVSVLPDEISFTDGEEIGMLGAGGLQILQVNDNSDSYSSEANEVSLSSGASNFYYTTPVNQTTDKYLHVCFSADGASFMASQGDKFNSFDIGYSSAKYSGNFAANKFVYTGNSLNYVECLEANDTTNVYFHSNGYYSFRVNNEGNWSNETQSVYITERGISVPGQIGLYSQEMSNYVARYYIAGSTKSTAIGNNSYQTRIYGSSVWANKTVSTSDVRLKQDFQSLDKFEDLYMQLQPVSFKYIDGYDKSEDRYFGLKAQPTEKLFEDMGENPDDYAMFNKFGIDHEDIKERIGYDVDFDEEHGLDYTNLITLNTHMVQKTRRELAELQKENAELKDMLKTIVKKINM